MTTTKECTICCETYNKSTHAKVTCEFGDCEYTACKTCIRTYLLGTTADPHCMNCKKSWQEKFIVENLNRSFCDKDYKSHRKQLLVDREMSRLPETMHLAERQKKINVEEEKGKVISYQIIELMKTVNQLKTERIRHANHIYHIRHGTDKEGEGSDRRKFIMACPNDNCRGYLSTQYKCELCDLFTCPHCIEIIGYSKTDPHECNPNSVASAEMIKKETKPCPSCGIRIYKISGCSQMWCTECNVAFDYNTGKIDNGVVHNPHYYAHMAQQNQGQAPRNPQDVVCGGLISVTNTNIYILNKLKLAIKDQDEEALLTTYISSVHRVISHITHNELYRFRNAVRELEDGEETRINYILGKIDKKEMGALIYRRDIKRKKQTELLHLFELLSVVGIENFNMLQTHGNRVGTQHTTPAEYAEFVDETNSKLIILDNLRQYCNTEFAKLSRTYNCKIMNITDTWEITTEKSLISKLKK